MTERGFIALPIMGWAAIAAGAVILGLSVAVKVQTSRLDSEKAAFSAFRAQVEAEGAAAAKEVTRVNLANQKAKEVSDGEYAKVKGDLASSYAAYRKLRNANSGSRTVPPAAKVTGSTDRTCYRSAEVTRAVGDFEAGISGAFGILETGIPQITEQGDSARLRLSTAVEWAASLAR